MKSSYFLEFLTKWRKYQKNLEVEQSICVKKAILLWFQPNSVSCEYENVFTKLIYLIKALPIESS